ncbi:RNA-binding S4 domain protein [Thermovirga lienii DSM 17291]|jgi:ribosomal 50S subunit-recycling heat shock protein|uniref:RQC P-site tRNA stabilizing factor n=1 Tax=Thermovirga lienii (strain ATCC BAA-1197 / DSM 17291 / Cas60314) TaxID=580340 RepID=G7V8Q2_THELD|nr:RNA-binding S4 domain-containing protein [Thermovirga lienii]AER66343.1 RNA-binding S4 domain protein [Thermovirga lienii DSM 17291]
MRIDKFLKLARVIKRRTLAQEMIEIGAVRVNGKVVKASKEIQPGDVVEVAFPSRVVSFKVLPFEEKELKRGARPFDVLEERKVNPDEKPWND